MNPMLTLKTMSGTCLLSTLVFAVAWSAPTMASEAGASQEISRSVRLVDVDLGTVAGRTEATRRVHRMAKKVCDEVVNARRYDARDARAACMQAAEGPALAALARAPAGQEAAAVAAAAPQGTGR